MVIKDGEIEILVGDTDVTMANVTTLAADYGGYILSSRTWVEHGLKYGSVRFAVPADAFETALNNVRILGESVLNETASGQDVSSEYVDLESRLTNLEATADRVRTFLEAAATVDEALAVSEELSALEAEIEDVKGDMRYYEGRTAFSTITVLVQPKPAESGPRPTPTATPPWSPAQTLKDSADVSVEIAQGLTETLIWLLVVPGPYLLIIYLVIRFATRRGRKGRRMMDDE
jgi:hypothetical protein